MSRPAEYLKSYQGKGLFLFVSIVLVAVNLGVLLDIPILGQFAGFIFLSFIPGFLILFMLRLNRMGLTEQMVLAVGLSICFVLLFGLIINALYPLLGNKTPLSASSLTVSFTILTIILAAIAYGKNRRGLPRFLASFSLTVKEKLWLLIPALFPLLSILGIQLMNRTENNALLMALLFLIPGYVILVAVMNRHFPQKAYAPAILFISISLLLLYLLRCPHIIGADIHTEYYLFQLTVETQHWQSWGQGPLDGCLTISLLPTIYQSFVHINPEYLYRIIYNFLFGLSPLVVFVISRRYVSHFMAFLAAFFFISQLTFVQSAGDGRNTVAIFFFALAIMVLSHEHIRELDKRLLFLIFGTAIIVSHYSTGYIFVAILFLTWFGIMLMSRITSLRKRAQETGTPLSQENSSGSSRYLSSKNMETQPLMLKNYITFGIAASLLFILFLWYSTFTGASFGYGVNFIVETFQQLNRFFIMESRTGLLGSAIGSTIVTGPFQVPKTIEMVSSWLTIILIATGVFTVLAQHLPMHIPPTNPKDFHPQWTKRIDVEYLILATVCCLMIAVTVLLPFVSRGYDLVRVYFMMMIVLAPFFVIGGVTVARLVRIHWHYLVVLTVLIPYFLCTTGTIYQALGAPKTMYLSSQSLEYDLYYVHDQDVYAARWLAQNRQEGITIYSFGERKLMSQGGLSSHEAGKELYQAYHTGQQISGYVYLNYLNVVKGKVPAPGYQMADIEPYKVMLSGKAKIYTNNGPEIYH